MKWILASDIDNTLTGPDSKSLINLSKQISKLRKENKLFLILCTGRRLDQVIEGFENEYIPMADAIVTQVGTEIYLPPYKPDQKSLFEYDHLLKNQYKRSEALSLLEGFKQVIMQPKVFNTPYKLSVYLDKTSDPENIASEIKQRAVQKFSAKYQVVWSSSRDLDIIPTSAGKANAIKFVINYKKITSFLNVIVAGDSGNDASMFDSFDYGIVVGNAKEELKKHVVKTAKPNHYFAKKNYAAGVHEGLKFFNIL